MSKHPEIGQGAIIDVPDGYYGNGDSRPWRRARVTRRNERYCEFRYIDGGEDFAPLHAVRVIQPYR